MQCMIRPLAFLFALLFECQRAISRDGKAGPRGTDGLPPDDLRRAASPVGIESGAGDACVAIRSEELRKIGPRIARAESCS